MLGEPIYMDFDVKNLSNVELGVLWDGDYRNEFGRPDSFNVKVINSKGETLQKTQTLGMGGLMGFQKITVGGNFNFRLYLPHWAKIEKTGDYKIEIEKSLIVKKYDRKIENMPNSKNGILVKVTSQINVNPSNYQKMGEVIDEIGEQLIKKDDTAERLVPFIEDERIIKYLIEAIENNHWLMRHLAKFNNDLALNALLSKINDDSEDVRRNVSITLASSVHSKATIYLLKMRNDKFYPIRLDVVHFLGKSKTTESTKILKEMIKDEDKLVSEESIRYLTERGEKLN